MDFSKIKKIFYIVAIISMLLSIKNKVFGAAFFYDVNRSNGQYTVDVSHFTNDLSNYKIFFSAKYVDNLGSGGQPRFSAYFFISDEEFTITDYNSTNQTFKFKLNNGQKYNYSYILGNTGLSTLQTFIDNQTGNNMLTATSSSNSFLFDIPGYANTTLENSDFYSNFTIKDQNGDTFIENTAMINPFFANPEELEDAPEYVFIELGDYSANDYLYFHLLEVTNIMPMSNNDSTYYYNDHTFALNKDSKYYTQLLDTTKYYYAIPRSALGLNPNTSYFYVLTNSSTQIANSINPITEGDGIYDVIMQDTTGIITQDMATNDKLQNINQEFRDYQHQQEEFQNQNSIMPDTETDINTNMNFNNSAPNFSNMYGSFFSRLSSTISGLGSYDSTTVETINLPIPFSQNTILLTSNMISQHMPTILTTLFTTFWLFIFGKYFLAYILYIYRLISSGYILDNINSNNEIITNDVL